MSSGAREIWVQILTQLLPACVTLGKLPHLSEQDWSACIDGLGRAKQVAGDALSVSFPFSFPGPEPWAGVLMGPGSRDPPELSESWDQAHVPTV